MRPNVVDTLGIFQCLVWLKFRQKVLQKCFLNSLKLFRIRLYWRVVKTMGFLTFCMIVYLGNFSLSQLSAIGDLYACPHELKKRDYVRAKFCWRLCRPFVIFYFFHFRFQFFGMSEIFSFPDNLLSDFTQKVDFRFERLFWQSVLDQPIHT